jgi:CubicO group peptidase (beta-lactamase class C family)
MNRRRCIAGLMGSALLPLNSKSYGASPSAASASHRWKAVQAVLDGFVRERNAPGVAVAISYGGSEPAYLSAGTIAFDSPVPFDRDSICRVYSITKNVTRIATLLLVEGGKIDIDQPVATVLPEFAHLRVSVDPTKNLESRPARKVMTMRHLITQTSGLGNWTPGSDSGEPLHKAYRERGITPGNFAGGLLRPGYGPQAPSMDEMVRRVAELPLVYEPGTVVHYSIGFDVMALVIERVTGMPYGKFLEQRLWGPLRMDSTGFQVAEKDAARLTTNYDATEGGANSVCKAPDPLLPPNWCVQDDRATSDRLKPPTLLAGGGSLLSTSRDFLRYALMLLNEGALDGTRVMKIETARLATGNINPAGVSEPDENVGAGSRRLMRGAPIIPPGMVGAGGSTGTLFWIDKARRGAVSFMVQVMYGSPARSPFQKRLFPAIEADLAAR